MKNEKAFKRELSELKSWDDKMDLVEKYSDGNDDLYDFYYDIIAPDDE